MESSLGAAMSSSRRRRSSRVLEADEEQSADAVPQTNMFMDLRRMRTAASSGAWKRIPFRLAEDENAPSQCYVEGETDVVHSLRDVRTMPIVTGEDNDIVDIFQHYTVVHPLINSLSYSTLGEDEVDRNIQLFEALYGVQILSTSLFAVLSTRWQPESRLRESAPSLNPNSWAIASTAAAQAQRRARGLMSFTRRLAKSFRERLVHAPADDEGSSTTSFSTSSTWDGNDVGAGLAHVNGYGGTSSAAGVSSSDAQHKGKKSTEGGQSGVGPTCSLSGRRAFLFDGWPTVSEAFLVNDSPMRHTQDRAPLQGKVVTDEAQAVDGTYIPLPPVNRHHLTREQSEFVETVIHALLIFAHSARDQTVLLDLGSATGLLSLLPALLPMRTSGILACRVLEACLGYSQDGILLPEKLVDRIPELMTQDKRAAFMLLCKVLHVAAHEPRPITTLEFNPHSRMSMTHRVTLGSTFRVSESNQVVLEAVPHFVEHLVDIIGIGGFGVLPTFRREVEQWRSQHEGHYNYYEVCQYMESFPDAASKVLYLCRLPCHSDRDYLRRRKLDPSARNYLLEHPPPVAEGPRAPSSPLNLPLQLDGAALARLCDQWSVYTPYAPHCRPLREPSAALLDVDENDRSRIVFHRHQGPLLTLLATLVSSKNRRSARMRAVQAGIVPVLYAVFRTGEWLQQGEDLPHGPNCTCTVEASPQYHALRLTYSLVESAVTSHVPTKRLLLSREEAESFGIVQDPDSPACTDEGQGALSLLLDLLMNQRCSTSYMGWICTCIEGFLRSSTNRERLFVIARGFLHFAVDAILDSEDELHPVLQSIMDVAAELCKCTRNSVELLVELLPEDKFAVFMDVCRKNLVASNVLLRSIVKTLMFCREENQLAEEGKMYQGYVPYDFDRCPFTRMTRLEGLSLLQDMCTTVEPDDLQSDNVCMVNSSIILAMYLEQQRGRQEVVQAFRGTGITEKGQVVDLRDNILQLLTFWTRYYARTALYRLNYEHSQRTSFEDVASFVKVLQVELAKGGLVDAEAAVVVESMEG